MVSFFSRLFGGSASRPEAGKTVDYQGYAIHPAPRKDNGQWRLAGEITKSTGESELRRTFVRADTFASFDEAESFTVRKAKQIIDERGEKLFADGGGESNI